LKRGRQRNKQQDQTTEADNRGSKRRNTSEDGSRPNRRKRKSPHPLGRIRKTSSPSTKRAITQKSKRRPRDTQKPKRSFNTPPPKRQKTSGEFCLEVGAQALMAVIGGMCFVVTAL
jgi:hypothetical protein